MSLAPNTVSLCENAIAGYNQHIFLHKGSNDLQSLYSKPPRGAGRWIDIIKKRHHFCHANGIDFFQLIVPEKQTIMIDMYPEPIQGATPDFASINTFFAPHSFYLNVYDILVAMYIHRSIEPYRRQDTHLSSAGCIGIASAIAGRYSKEASHGLVNCVHFGIADKAGDLGKKFRNLNLVESVKIPLDDSTFFRGKVECWHFIEPAHKKKRGIEVFYRNSEPYIDKSLLIFGNSFCERGLDPLGMTWWFARIFKEVKFIWSPDVSRQRILEEKADIVISQTVERFLPVLPRDS